MNIKERQEKMIKKAIDDANQFMKKLNCLEICCEECKKDILDVAKAHFLDKQMLTLVLEQKQIELDILKGKNKGVDC